MADSLRYQALGAIGINQHYYKIDISEVPPPNLSPPLVIATKVFVCYWRWLRAEGECFNASRNREASRKASKHINAACAYTSFVKQPRT
jgi:hypothetical protein